MKHFRIIQRRHPIDFYHDEPSEDYVIQKKGWFGWKSGIDVYDGNFMSHFGWSYFDEPGRNDPFDTFETVGRAKLFILTHYNQCKITIEVIEEATLSELAVEGCNG